MQKIILDTNVIVSSLIQKNYPFLIVEHCIEGNVEICISNEIIQEYIEVLNRPKFSRFYDFKINADFLITRISEMAELFEPQNKLNLIKDETDNRLLELAQLAKADFIITGNTNDFNLENFEGTKIVTPKEYWEKYKQ